MIVGEFLLAFGWSLPEVRSQIEVNLMKLSGYETTLFQNGRKAFLFLHDNALTENCVNRIIFIPNKTRMFPFRFRRA